ncbi:hypothetical protein BK133_14840 [Paenibacillus sp. FSL H8-0548]|nr:hypothetical protein BK133_14840 [Paenibacillus sp. FSL H8-0548]
MTLLYRIGSKTIVKIFIIITMCSVLLVVFFSNIMFRQIEKLGLNITYDYNQRILSQNSQNIKYMNNAVKDFMTAQFLQPNTANLMYRKEEENFFTQSFINSLALTVKSNAMLHSAVIYNHFLQGFYSTSGSGAFTHDPEVELLITEGQHYPILEPIPRLLPLVMATMNREVFTYLLYDDVDEQKVPMGALIVNVNMDWLRNNLNEFSRNDRSIMIIDKDGNVIVDGSSQLAMFDRIPESLFNRIIAEDEAGSSFIMEIDNKKRVLTYLLIPDTEWYIISNEPYETVFKPIRYVLNQTIWYTFFFIFLAVIVALFVSRTIYRPFGKLVKLVKNTWDDPSTPVNFQDDHEYLTSIFNISLRELGDYKKRKSTADEIIRDNAFKSILLGNSVANNPMKDVRNNEIQDLLLNVSHYRLILIQIDQFHVLNSMNVEEEKLIHFAVTNVADEVLGEENPFIQAHLDKRNFVYYVQCDPDEPALSKALEDHIHQIQSLINRISRKLSVSVVYSAVLDDHSAIREQFLRLQSRFEDRFFVGYGQILRERNQDSTFEQREFVFPSQSVDQLMVDIRSGHLEEASSRIKETIDQVTVNYDRDATVFPILRIAFMINRMVHELNTNRMQVIEYNFNEFCADILKADELKQIAPLFLEMIESIMARLQPDTEQKHSLLISSVLHYIEQESDSTDLSLKAIAASFNISANYLGQIFKDEVGKSVAQYIHDLRMEHVLELLKNTSKSVKEIAAKVGYNNEATFYKLFKKQYGITPAEYRHNLVLKQNNKL